MSAPGGSVGTATAPSVPGARPGEVAGAARDGSHDFDFWFGRWHVANERLVRRLAGSDAWERFEATQECRPILGGVGNIDDFVTDWGGGFVGMTLRLYDVDRREWSLYWAGNRTGTLEPPVVGRFEDGVGTFYGRDVHEGRPVRVRFLWSQISRDGALWQQAFSADEGATWETNWIMHMARIDDAGRHDAPDRAIAPAANECAVVELRRYTLHPGRRDELIDLFERAFVESQEACGMRLVGQFRDLDDPDRFVWLRGFRGMADRAAALTAFYGGATWKAHRAAANATMIDSDDVLLLRPAHAGSGFALDAGSRAAAGGAPAAAPGLVVALLWPLADDSAERLATAVGAWLALIGARPLASFVSEHAENTFPALPVRVGENVYACFAGLDDEAHWHRHAGEVARIAGTEPRVLRLAPTLRSLLRG